MNLYIPMTYETPYVPELQMISQFERKHPHLNSITPETLSNLIIDAADILVVDCRFAYEF
jgi:hypothetical protein